MVNVAWMLVENKDFETALMLEITFRASGGKRGQPFAQGAD